MTENINIQKYRISAVLFFGGGDAKTYIHIYLQMLTVSLPVEAKLLNIFHFFW